MYASNKKHLVSFLGTGVLVALQIFIDCPGVCCVFPPTGRLTRADEKHTLFRILFLMSMFASFVNTPNIHVIVHHPFSTVHIALVFFCEIGETKDAETNWLQTNVPRCVGMGQHFQHLPVGLLFVFFTQQRKLMGPSTQNSSVCIGAGAGSGSTGSGEGSSTWRRSTFQKGLQKYNVAAVGDSTETHFPWQKSLGQR